MRFSSAERGEARKGAQVLSAALAKLRDTPAPSFDEAGTEEAMRVLIGLLPSKEADRLADTLANLPQRSDEDVCWVAKTLCRGVLELEAPHRTVVARVIDDGMKTTGP